MLRFGLFDLDDTLYGAQSGLWSAIGSRIDRYLVERMGVPAASVTSVRREYFDTYGTTINGLRALHQIDPADYLAFVHDLPLEDYLQPNPALDAMLTRLPVEKIIFTNADAPHALRVVNRLGIAHHFKTVIDIQALAFANKPEPRAYQMVLDTLGATGEECFFVDDAPRNLQPARLLGMWTVLMSPPPMTAKVARVDAVISDILDLEAALQKSGRLAPPALRAAPEGGRGMTLLDRDRARAMLYGLALGDALGWPVEFMGRPEILANYGRTGIQAPPDPALYTDDTQMSVAVAEALIEAGPRDLDVLMGAVARNFIGWKKDPTTPRRAPGVTSMRGVNALEQGAPWREAGVRDLKGCGGCMRVAPVGYFYQYEPGRLQTVARAQGVLTHRHPTSDAACMAAAYLIKLALEPVEPTEYPERDRKFVGGLAPEFDQAIERVSDVLSWADEEAALNYIGPTRGGGWIAEEAVAMALYCVLRHPQDYVAAVRLGANISGDSDSVASIAGGIMGARLGTVAIPAEWIARLENRAYLQDLAERLARKKADLVTEAAQAATR